MYERIEAIQEAAEVERDEVPGDPTDFKYGYVCGLERAADIVQGLAHGVTPDAV